MARKIKKALKMITFSILGIIALLAIVGIIFVYTSPEFGGKATEADLKKYSQSERFNGEIFENEVETNMDMKPAEMAKTMWEFIKGVENGRPKSSLPQEELDSTLLANYDGPSRLIWFGHSAFLLQMEGKNIFIDPMLGKVPAPHPLLGGNRFNEKLPLDIESLPSLDAIIISHDHYDHLDYNSIKTLKDRTSRFLAPLGVGKHLREWGIDQAKIEEFDWWEKTQLADIELVFAPARHFSGRGFGDRFKSLWGSWIILGSDEKLYFSGDGGYGPHFKSIGEKYGPFDLALMECGQYNERWAQIHMMPEETAQAGVDVNARIMMPIHWGAFTLALHSWTDPVERVVATAKSLGLNVVSPRIGESIRVSLENPVLDRWWER
jgi:L-ascorbate metabolism protein UlaG (beta-lactamase superfamily)